MPEMTDDCSGPGTAAGLAPPPGLWLPGGDRLAWRPLDRTDLPALIDLAGRCVGVDGGQPFAVDPGFLSASYLTAGQAIGIVEGPALVCACAVRRIRPPASGQHAVTCGMVDPAWRRRGLGAQGLDWALAWAGRLALVAESESLSDGAHALYASRRLARTMAEQVMQLPAGVPVPQVVAPAGLTLAEWGAARPDRFFAVYTAAFASRPGFARRPASDWIAWISDDEDFRPDWTLLASLDGADVGFIAGEATGWIAQVGVVPQARGRGIGASLIGEVTRRMRAAGETSVTLNVADDNPGAQALYRRLGFVQIGRRGRYRIEPPGARDQLA